MKNSSVMLLELVNCKANKTIGGHDEIKDCIKHSRIIDFHRSS